jgi:hypothetical protein
VSLTLDFWLQDAIIDFLRDLVRDRVVPKKHPEAADTYIGTDATASLSSIKVYWHFDRDGRFVSGEEWFTPRDALALFLAHGASEGEDVWKRL